MKLRAWIWLISLMVVASTGCVSVRPTPFTESTPLGVEDTLRFNLSLIYETPDVASIRGKSLTVKIEDPRKTINPEYSEIMNPIDWNLWRADFEDYLADVMWQSCVFSDVGATTDTQPIAHPDLTLRVSVTRWHEGSPWPRFIVGFGLGATRLQWEGELVETATGRQLFAFADARMHPGGPSMLGPNLKALHGERLIAEDLRYGCQDLSNALRSLTGTTEPVRSQYLTRPKIHMASMRPALPPTEGPKPD